MQSERSEEFEAPRSRAAPEPRRARDEPPERSDILLRRIDLTGPRPPFVAPQIRSARDLDAHLPAICAAIYEQLTSKQLEATYQRCLAIELESGGVSVDQEVSIALTYKGVAVGTRRADLVLSTDDGCRSIVELKAVAGLLCKHLTQLEFYMHHFDIDVGYLVNFKHEAGFLDVGELGSVFSHCTLAGPDAGLSDRTTRKKRFEAAVQIVKVTRVAAPDGKSARPPAPLRAAPESQPRVGITKKGELCKVCIKEGALCKWHCAR